MMQTCISCNVKNNGMIAIYRHPNSLDVMFHLVTGINVNPDEYLCVPCYDDMKLAHRFKQRCIQNSVLRLSVAKQPIKSVLGQPEGNSNDVNTKSEITITKIARKSDEKAAQQDKTDIVKSVEKEDVPKSLKDTAKKHQIEHSHSLEQHFDDLPTNDDLPMEDNEDITTSEQMEECTLPNEDKRGDILEKDDESQEESVNSAPNDVNDKDEKSHRDTKAAESSTTKTLPRLPKVHSLMCEFCFKEFEVLADKIEHTGTHQSEEKPFKCVYPGCPSSFKDRVGLRAHVRIHSPVKRFGCRYCSMRFHTQGNRNSHERIHNGEKPFLCPKCGKGFAEAGNLKNHIRFHNGERPYPCSICEKSYRTHYSRSVHMRSHTNERPFVCSECGKGFFSSGKLTIHKRTHTGERPYECNSCTARFADTCVLRRHVIKVH